MPGLALLKAAVEIGLFNLYQFHTNVGGQQTHGKLTSSAENGSYQSSEWKYVVSHKVE